MSKDIADYKKEVLGALCSCLSYLFTEKLCLELKHKDTKAEDELIQSIIDTVELFTPELVEGASHE